MNLSPRQREITQLVANGESNKGIARVLDIELGTVKAHLYQIYRKFTKVRSRAHLAVMFTNGEIA